MTPGDTATKDGIKNAVRQKRTSQGTMNSEKNFAYEKPNSSAHSRPEMSAVRSDMANQFGATENGTRVQTVQKANTNKFRENSPNGASDGDRTYTPISQQSDKLNKTENASGT